MPAISVNTRGQEVTPAPQQLPAAGQAVAKNHARISEVTFFSSPERPEHSKVRHEPHTLEFIIIVAVILLGIMAYFWVEQSNVVKRLGEPVAVKQQAVPSPRPPRDGVRSSTAEAQLKKMEAPEKIEPPEMGHAQAQPPVAIKQEPAIASHNKIAPKKIPAAAPVTAEQLPEPSPSPAAEPVPAQPAHDNVVTHAEEAYDNHASAPAEDDVSAQTVTEPSVHHKAASKSHKLSLAESRPSKNEETVGSADPVKEFLKKWGESIKQGETHPNCTQQARALNQCH